MKHLLLHVVTSTGNTVIFDLPYGHITDMLDMTKAFIGPDKHIIVGNVCFNKDHIVSFEVKEAAGKVGLDEWRKNI